MQLIYLINHEESIKAFACLGSGLLGIRRWTPDKKIADTAEGQKTES
jgi:hypothetical protein